MSRETRTRDACEADYAAFERFYAELSLDEPPPPIETWKQEFMGGTFFLFDGDEAIAYGCGSEVDGEGYVIHCVSSPERRGEGLGKAVMAELARRFRTAGCKRWCLNVLDDNRVAIGLYSALGMQVCYPTSVLRVPATELHTRAQSEAGPSHLRVREATRSEHDALEAGHGLRNGHLTRVRANPSQIVLCIVDEREPERRDRGLARFDPAFPGAFPFRAPDDTSAWTLVDAMWRLSRQDAPWLQLVLEDQTELAAGLIRAGSELRYKILHLEGEL